MITDIQIEDNFEEVYDLNSIGIEGELIITPEKQVYLLTKDDYFSIIEGDNLYFTELEDKIVLKSDDDQILEIKGESIEIFKNILQSQNLD